MYFHRLIFCSLAATLASFASQVFVLAEPLSAGKAASSADAVEMNTYSGFGGIIKFDYPADWSDQTEIEIGGHAGHREYLFEDKYGAKCKVDVMSVENKQFYPDKLSTLHSVTGYPNSKSDVLKECYLKIGGDEIYERVFKHQMFRSPDCPIISYFNFVILKDKTAYVLVLECRFDVYDRYLPIFERMGKSFRVQTAKTTK